MVIVDLIQHKKENASGNGKKKKKDKHMPFLLP